MAGRTAPASLPSFSLTPDSLVAPLSWISSWTLPRPTVRRSRCRTLRHGTEPVPTRHRPPPPRAPPRMKDLVVDNLYVSLIQVNLAQKQHKRIDTYMSSPCHSELFLLEKEDPMKKEVRKRAKRSESRRGR
uniref:60S ribosomal protein L17 n=1 Tax=Zea mays TaxID=4577 RepID=A0A804MGJ5_MAIZE